jgi:hypothetical protein
LPSPVRPVPSPPSHALAYDTACAHTGTMPCGMVTQADNACNRPKPPIACTQVNDNARAHTGTTPRGMVTQADNAYNRPKPPVACTQANDNARAHTTHRQNNAASQTAPCMHAQADNAASLAPGKTMPPMHTQHTV